MYPLIDNILGMVGLLGHAILLYVLIYRKEVRVFPFFTTWIAYIELESIVDFLVRTTMPAKSYFLVYWTLSGTDYLLQLAVLYEIANNVLRPKKRQLPKTAFWILGVLSFLSLIATAVVLNITKQTAAVWFDRVTNGASFAFTLSRCLLFAGITAFSRLLGISWRSHVQRIATGLAIYSVIDFIVDYIYTSYQNRFFDYYRIAAYTFSLAFWICTLWTPEPERKPLAPQVEELLYRVHRTVKTDRKLVESARDPK